MERKSTENLVGDFNIVSTSLSKIIHDCKKTIKPQSSHYVDDLLHMLPLFIRWHTPPSKNSTAVCVRVRRSAPHCLHHYFLGINFPPLKKQETYAFVLCTIS